MIVLVLHEQIEAISIILFSSASAVHGATDRVEVPAIWRKFLVTQQSRHRSHSHSSYNQHGLKIAQKADPSSTHFNYHFKILLRSCFINRFYRLPQTGLRNFCDSVRSSVALIDGELLESDAPLTTTSSTSASRKKSKFEAGDTALKHFDVELFGQVVRTKHAKISIFIKWCNMATCE